NATEYARGARSIRILVWIEGIATTPGAGCSRGRRFLHDRRRRCDLRLIGRLLLAIDRRSLRRRYRRDIPPGRHRSCSLNFSLDCSWDGCGLRAAFELPDAVLELAVAILQLFVLAGELAELIFQPLDSHLRIGIIRLRERGRTQ